MERIRRLSIGTKLPLLSGPLLFVNLSFTWQKVEIDYGPAGKGEHLIDGWDAWGLLIGFLTLGVVTLAVLVHLTDVELPPDVHWGTVLLALSVVVLGLTVVKTLLDAGSTLPSYVGIALAGATATGAYLERRAPAFEPQAATNDLGESY